jgi:hypothetical protein
METNNASSTVELVDFSSADAWLSSSAEISDALDALVYAHPAFCSLAVREELASGARFAVLEFPRRARKDPARVELVHDDSQALGAAFEAAFPGAPEQARSLGAALALLQPWTRRKNIEWAAPLAQTMDSLGWGSSSRWDPNHEDGLARDGEDGVEVFERACAESLPKFAAAVALATQTGSQWLSGAAAESCRAMGSMAEAAEIEREPAVAAPERSAPRARL